MRTDKNFLIHGKKIRLTEKNSTSGFLSTPVFQHANQNCPKVQKDFLKCMDRI